MLRRFNALPPTILLHVPLFSLLPSNLIFGFPVIRFSSPVTFRWFASVPPSAEILDLILHIPVSEVVSFLSATAYFHY
jgi:hypothetical protein